MRFIYVVMVGSEVIEAYEDANSAVAALWNYNNPQSPYRAAVARVPLYIDIDTKAAIRNFKHPE